MTRTWVIEIPSGILKPNVDDRGSGGRNVSIKEHPCIESYPLGQLVAKHFGVLAAE